MLKRLTHSVCGALALCTGSLGAQSLAPHSTSHPAPAASAGERPTSLEEVLRHASKHAPLMRVARAGTLEARARITAAGPALPSEPVLSGSVGWRQADIGAGLDYSIALEQELDLAGRRGAALDAARAGLRARESEVHATEWTVHQSVHEAFHEALIARERAHAADRSARFAERLVQVSSQRFLAGETSELPLRIARAESARARQAALLARSDYHGSRLKLAELAGFTSSELLTPSDPLVPPAAPPPVESLLRIARKKQPTLAAARSWVEAARADLDATGPRAWPNPTVGISYESEANPAGAPDQIVRGTFSVPLPFWIGNTGAHATAEAELERTRAERDAIEAVLEVRIREAHERVRASAARARMFGAEVLPNFETNLEMLDKAFELGEIDVLEVMVAQERFLRSEQEALQIFSDYYAAWATLEAVVGVELDGAVAPGRSP